MSHAVAGARLPPAGIAIMAAASADSAWQNNKPQASQDNVERLRMYGSWNMGF